MNFTSTSVPRWAPGGRMELSFGAVANSGCNGSSIASHQMSFFIKPTMESSRDGADGLDGPRGQAISSLRTLPSLTIVDGPVAGGHQLLVGVDAQLVVDRVAPGPRR